MRSTIFTLARILCRVFGHFCTVFVQIVLLIEICVAEMRQNVAKKQHSSM